MMWLAIGCFCVAAAQCAIAEKRSADERAKAQCKAILESTASQAAKDAAVGSAFGPCR